MNIIGSQTSPFVRMTRVVCEELGLEYDFTVTGGFGKQDRAAQELISRNNPLMKVPVLVDGELTIPDSRIMIGYFLKKSSSTKPATGDFRASDPLPMEEENWLTMIYGVIDAGVLRFMLQRQHPELEMDRGYMAKSLARMNRGLEWLEQQETLGETFGVPEAALLCGLEWFGKREVIDWQPYGKLVEIHRRFAERSSMVKTRIPESV